MSQNENIPEASDSTVATAEDTQQETPSLDSLLGEFETSQQSVDPQPAAEPVQNETPQNVQQQPQTVSRDEFNRLQEQIWRRDTQDAVAHAVTTVKETPGLENVSDRLVKDILEGAAMRDPRIGKAFAQRDVNPEAYAKVLKSMGKEINKELGLQSKQPDPKITADQEALRATVKGQDQQNETNAPATPHELSSMSKNEFEDYKKGLLSQQT